MRLLDSPLYNADLKKDMGILKECVLFLMML